ncbi:MAG: tetratricopeptide repeat protein [Bacteroidetes bacterium]|nr:tetratricopeptide repeat protein [Bacteroidota bacterium]
MKIAPTLIALTLLALGATNAQGQYIEQLKEKAEQGDPKAQYTLGEAYRDGRGVIENYTQALHWYRKASMQGHPAAQVELGLAYALGRGVDQDDQEAYAWMILVKATGELNQEGVEHLDGFLEFLRDNYLTPDQLAKAQQRASELHEQIQANTATN